MAQPAETPPTFQMEQTWCGLRSAATRTTARGDSYVRVSTFAMPFIGTVPRGPMVDGRLDGYLVVYQVPEDDFHTWRYNFRCRPAWLAPLAERIGIWVLGRDIRRRIAGYARGCTDPVVLAAVDKT